MPDGRHDVVQLAPVRFRVVDVIGHDHGKPQLGGETGGLSDEPVVVGQQMVLELDDEPGRTDRADGTDRGGRPFACSRAPSSDAPPEQPGIALGAEVRAHLHRDQALRLPRSRVWYP